jgi:hypothetical protein
MARTALDTLNRRVVEYFRKNAARYGLNPKLLEAHYILNWGGFVNASFHLTDGHIHYHLKLADDEDSLERLDQWREFNEILAEQYHAPRMLDWAQIPRTDFEGGLFEFIPGQPVDFAAQPDVLDAVLELLPLLHADQELAAALAAIVGETLTCTDYFLSVYINRFDGDLAIIAGDLPPFVPLRLLDWMMGETRELEGLARDLPAFQQPAVSPTHGDLWPSNILVTGDGQFYIIDWDDLALGDPALEYSILLGPLWRKGKFSQAEIDQRVPNDPAFRERFNVCLRALVLDEVIDTLADWVESDFAPEHQAEVRAAKEHTHRESLELYRQLYQE